MISFGYYALFTPNAPPAIFVATAPNEYTPTVIEPSAVDSARSWYEVPSYHVYASGLMTMIESSMSVVADVFAVT